MIEMIFFKYIFSYPFKYIIQRVTKIFLQYELCTFLNILKFHVPETFAMNKPLNNDLNNNKMNYKECITLIRLLINCNSSKITIFQ